MTWPEVQAHLDSTRGILIPIGSTEQHGPTGLIGTDALTAEGLAVAAAETLKAIVAPTIAVGMAQHHLGFPGSASLRPSTLIAVVRDIITSMASYGFERFFFVNGHGGNIAPVSAAFSEIYAEASFSGRASKTRCALFNWWEAKGLSSLVRELYGDQEGAHATASEVALAAHYHPGQLRQTPLHPVVAPPDQPFFDAADYRRRFPDGRIGSNPALSREEHGARIHEVAVADIVARYRAFTADEGPRA